MSSRAPKEDTNVPTGNQDFGATERSGLEREMSSLRLVALVGFSLAVLLLLLVFIFDTSIAVPNTRLLLLSSGHILLAVVAGYASLRCGPILIIALVLAVIQTILDLVHFVIRTVGLSFDLVAIVTFFFVAFLLVIDVLYLVSIWRLRTVISALQQRTEYKRDEKDDPAVQEKAIRDGLLSQESNTVRLAALFGGFTVAALLFFTLVFVGFGPRYAWLSLFHASHILLALAAIAIFEASTIAAIFIMFFAVGQLAADGLAFVFRLSDVSLLTGTVSLTSIATLIYFLINVCLLLVDAVYISAALTYAYVRSGADPTTVTSMAMVQKQIGTEYGAFPTLTTASSRINAFQVRKRK